MVQFPMKQQQIGLQRGLVCEFSTPARAVTWPVKCRSVPYPLLSRSVRTRQISSACALPESTEQQNSVETKLSTSVYDFYQEEETENGLITIRALKRSDIGDAVSLLLQAFSETLGYANSFKWFLRKQIQWYLEDCLNLAPKGIVLVATLTPSPDKDAAEMVDGGFMKPMFQNFSLKEMDMEDERTVSSADTVRMPATEKTVSNVFLDFRSDIDSNALKTTRATLKTEARTEQNGTESGTEADSTTSQVAEDRNESSSLDAVDKDTGGKQRPRDVLLGTLDLSLEESSRDAYFFLKPPSDAAYICNMAVNPVYRRQGHASRLLRRAEEIVKNEGISEIYLHLLVEDKAAENLYKKFGYSVAKTHSPLIKVLGQEQKHLMQKTID